MGKNLGEVFCSVCNISSNDDVHFHKRAQLCNRHWLQIKRHGKPTGNDRMFAGKKKDCCEVCGDKCYLHVWNKEGEYFGMTLCNKHYLQLSRSGALLDREPPKHIKKRRSWTDEDKRQLEELYKKGLKFYDIAKIMDRTVNAINFMSCELKLGDKYIKSNNVNYKAIYQDYNWCYERYINKGMSHEEMAKEADCSVRVIKKWCSDIHHLNNHTFKEKKKLSNDQIQLIKFSLLGDGHIDRRTDQPMYIESHAENQKNYLYWKYNIIKDLCNKEPSYIKPFDSYFESTGKTHHCQGQYRICTRIIYDLTKIRDMKRIDIIDELNEFGFSIHMLDDASRGESNWTLCLAEYSQEEIDLYIKICRKRFKLNAKQLKSKIYIIFDAISSRKIDQIILNNLPNDLDIIKYKILNNNIHTPQKYIYVHTSNGEVGLSSYCRKNKIPYLKAKEFIDDNNLTSINNEILDEVMKELKYA